MPAKTPHFKKETAEQMFRGFQGVKMSGVEEGGGEPSSGIPPTKKAPTAFAVGAFVAHLADVTDNLRQSPPVMRILYPARHGEASIFVKKFVL